MSFFTEASMSPMYLISCLKLPYRSKLGPLPLSDVALLSSK